MEFTATVRLREGPWETVCETRHFSTLPRGLESLAAWLAAYDVAAAAREGTGVNWRAPWDQLNDAGIKVKLLHALHVKQSRGRNTGVEDGRWLARV